LTEGLVEDVNNYYDSRSNCIYLVGKRSAINRFTFELDGVVNYFNNDVLTLLYDAYNAENEIEQFGLKATKKLISPKIILQMIFGNFGSESMVYAVNAFMNETEFGFDDDFDSILLNIYNIIGSHLSAKQKKQGLSILYKTYQMTTNANLVNSAVTTEEEAITGITSDNYIIVNSLDADSEYKLFTF